MCELIWQPIATALQDGSSILLTDDSFIIAAFRDTDYDQDGAEIPIWNYGAADVGDGFVPTHWAPVPDTWDDGGWLPIAEAPRDGSDILLTDGGAIVQGAWEEVDYSEFWGKSYYGWVFGPAIIDDSNFTPTGWRPLPRRPHATAR